MSRDDIGIVIKCDADPYKEDQMKVSTCDMGIFFDIMEGDKCAGAVLNWDKVKFLIDYLDKAMEHPDDS